jgi:hypothetical protein
VFWVLIACPWRTNPDVADITPTRLPGTPDYEPRRGAAAEGNDRGSVPAALTIVTS